ncbi:MAG: hypothetical protein IIC11_08010 [Proteobacteria bacterium]|nr:hypothetical protein [Pseudomonadota bacterium]
MGNRVINRVKSASLWMGVLTLALACQINAAETAPDIGPLPTIKTDAAKAELGKRLFFDKRLSGDAAISCASCHIPKNGYGHPDALSPGYPGNKHFRNSQTLINTAHKKTWMHDGPGNVRELQNVLLKAVATCTSDLITRDLIPDYLMNDYPESHSEEKQLSEMSLEEMEKSHVARVLEATGWHRGKACEILGVSRPRLRRIIKQYKLIPPTNIQYMEDSH